jgi:hypothetical protein
MGRDGRSPSTPPKFWTWTGGCVFMGWGGRSCCASPTFWTGGCGLVGKAGRSSWSPPKFWMGGCVSMVFRLFMVVGCSVAPLSMRDGGEVSAGILEMITTQERLKLMEPRPGRVW